MKRTTAKKATLTFNMDASQLACVPVLQPELPAPESTSASAQTQQQSLSVESTLHSEATTSVVPAKPHSESQGVAEHRSESKAGIPLQSQQSNTTFYLPSESDDVAMRSREMSQDRLHDVDLNSEQSSLYQDSARANAVVYEPVCKHWFFKTDYEGKSVWTPFSKADNAKLDCAYMTQSALPISVEGGRFDVLIPQRRRKAVYWNVPACEIRLSSWFVRYSTDGFYVPFDEQTADALESEYALAMRTGSWPRRVEMANGAVVLHSETTVLFYLHATTNPAGRVAGKPPSIGLALTANGNTSESDELGLSGEAPKLAGSSSTVLTRPDGVLPMSTSLSSLQSVAKSSQVLLATEGQPNSEATLLQSERAGVVVRGMDQFEIENGEADRIAHLVFVVHGIGPVCDLRGHSVYECVDALRTAAQRIATTHFPHATQVVTSAASSGLPLGFKFPSSCNDTVGRVEFLPVFWHSALHSDVTDRQLGTLTLPTVPKLRDFTNRTLMDVLFYASPRFGASIRDAVAAEVNRLYETFVLRNPGWNGHVSMAGHSLGSVILFDLLANQPSFVRDSDADSGIAAATEPGTPTALANQLLSAEPVTSYPVLKCDRLFCFFAIGSPLSLFLTARGVRELPADFHLATCRRFFSVFHPFDPVAYRIEPMLDVSYASLPPVTLPHHKGRKRLHLEFKEGLARGSEVTQKVVSTLKSTFQSLFNFSKPSKSSTATPLQSSSTSATQQDNAEQFAEQIVEATLACLANQSDGRVSQSAQLTPSTNGLVQTQPNAFELPAALNGGRRVDYQLQESPWESMNEYLGCVAAHTCYWESLDTALFILSELYAASGLSPLPPSILPNAFPSATSQAALLPSTSARPLNFSRLRTTVSSSSIELASPDASIGIANKFLVSPHADAPVEAVGAAPISQAQVQTQTQPQAQLQPQLQPANRILQTGIGFIKSYMQKPRSNLPSAPVTNAPMPNNQPSLSTDSPAPFLESRSTTTVDQKKDSDIVIDFD